MPRKIPGVRGLVPERGCLTPKHKGIQKIFLNRYLPKTNTVAGLPLFKPVGLKTQERNTANNQIYFSRGDLRSLLRATATAIKQQAIKVALDGSGTATNTPLIG